MRIPLSELLIHKKCFKTESLGQLQVNTPLSSFFPILAEILGSSDRVIRCQYVSVKSGI